MIDLLRPEVSVRPRPTEEDASRYVRSYLVMRAFVGALGIVLPVALVAADRLLFDGQPFPRDSLSAYYHSGVRDLFVGVLAATAVFLVTYKVTDRTLDNTLSTLAGLAVLVVALFPTGAPGTGRETAFQQLLGESLVEAVHFTAAAVFIVSLAVISYYFGVREGARPEREGKRSPAFWRSYHWSCAGAVVATLLWIGVTALAGWPDRSLLVGEAVAVWAFGVSWLMKGLELDILRGTRRPDEADAAAAA